MTRRIFIGTSGWNYKAWKDTFYEKVPQKNWLVHYSRYFNSVEVNATFYRELKESTYQKWLQNTSPEFCFVVKGNRYITHIKRLKDPEDSVARQRDNLSVFADRLQAVLWQLPFKLEKDISRLQAFASALKSWPQVRHVLEMRHSTWFDQEVAELLQANNLAICQSDAPDWKRWDRVTAGLAYIRLHGNRELYRSEYTSEELQEWAEKIKSWQEQGILVHVYFDNTDNSKAPLNALQLKEMLGDGQ